MPRKSSFTPGPWGFGITNDNERLVLGDSGNGQYVCHVRIHQTPRHAGLYAEPEREANAKLIAEAPAMYEALRVMTVFIADCLLANGEHPASDAQLTPDGSFMLSHASAILDKIDAPQK